MVGYTGVGCGTTVDRYDSLALFQFDDNDKVIDHEIFVHRRTAKSECTRFGVCAVNALQGLPPYIELLAEDSSDKAAKGFVAPSNGCSIYVYMDAKSYVASESIFSLDEGKSEYIDIRSFFVLHENLGAHVLSMTINHDSYDSYSESVNIDCRKGEVYFLRGTRKFAFTTKNQLDFQHVAEREGKQEIRERQLVLTTYGYPQN